MRMLKVKQPQNKVEPDEEQEVSGRKSKSEYFSDICRMVAARATCLRLHVGAIIVSSDEHILSTGYNGAPKGMEHCQTCLRIERNIPHGQNYEICRSVHAEQNAIIQAAVNGVSVKGATLYCTHTPCYICSKMIVNAEIAKVIVSNKLDIKDGEKVLEDAGIDLEYE